MTSVLGGILWNEYASGAADTRRAKHWFLERLHEKKVIAGYQKRRHYLRVLIRIESERVRLHVVDSRRLRQTETRIHKNAKLWIEDLEMDIRDVLGRASLARANLDAKELSGKLGERR